MTKRLKQWAKKMGVTPIVTKDNKLIDGNHRFSAMEKIKNETSD